MFRAVSPLRPGDLFLAEAPLSHPLIPPLTDLARRVAEPAGLTVRQVVLLTHHIPQTVQVVVERIDGSDVTLEACAALSGPLGEALEGAGLMESAYVLEVSSPGLGDVLETDRDFTSFRGFPVEVALRPEAGGPTSRSGLLLGRTEDTVSINVRGRTLRLPRDAVLEVRLTQAQDP
ncbi:MAG: ribosome assembly cofactor RimP [Cyanobacteriota bacterium]|nr:ribosome assembly cofactor RimP [Cyanobacteriota bacterium]